MKVLTVILKGQTEANVIRFALSR